MAPTNEDDARRHPLAEQVERFGASREPEDDESIGWQAFPGSEAAGPEGRATG